MQDDQTDKTDQNIAKKGLRKPLFNLQTVQKMYISVNYPVENVLDFVKMSNSMLFNCEIIRF